MKVWKIIRVLIGIFIIALLIDKIGIDNLYFVFGQVSIQIFLFAVISTAWNIFMGAIVLNKFLHTLEFKLGYLRVLKYYFAAWCCGLILPGKIGELSVVYFLNKDGVAVDKGIAASIAEKACTAVVIGVVGIIGVYNIFNESINRLMFIAIIISVLALFLSVMLFLVGKGRTILSRFENKFSNKFFSKFLKYSKKITESFYCIKQLLFSRAVIVPLILNVVNWAGMAFGLYLLFLYMGIFVPYIIIFEIIAIGVIIAFIPVSVSGLGTREAAFVYLYGLYGVEPAIVLAIYLTIIVIVYTTAALYLSVLFKLPKIEHDINKVNEQ